MTPDQRRLETHLQGGPFLEGVAEGRWQIIPHEKAKWPDIIFRVFAAKRDKSPSHYDLRSNCDQYPMKPATSTFWDIEKNAQLEEGKRPWGTGLVAMVLRTDWNGGTALYHPYDRVAALTGHNEWPQKYPYWVWDENHTIVDLLSVIHELLHHTEYTGIRQPQ